MVHRIDKGKALRALSLLRLAELQDRYADEYDDAVLAWLDMWADACGVHYETTCAAFCRAIIRYNPEASDEFVLSALRDCLGVVAV